MQRLNCELHALQGKSQPGAQCRVETGQVQPFVMHLGLDQISCHGCAMQQLYQDALCVCAEVRVKNTKMAGSGTDGKVAGGKGGGQGQWAWTLCPISHARGRDTASLPF